MIFIGGFIASYYIIKHEVAATISSQLGTLQAGVSDLQNFQPQSAAQEFSSLNASTSAAGVWGSLVSLFGGSNGAIHSFTDLAGQLAILSEDMANIENDAFTFISPNGSSTLAADLGSTRDTLAALDADSNALSGAQSYFGGVSQISGSGYLALKTQIGARKVF